MSEKGLLIVLSAPSGCGKSTIVKGLLEKKENISFSVSATTRKPRPGEVEGKDYYFITREKFDRMIENGEFLEYATYVENSYGTPAAPVRQALEEGQDVLLDIDVQGAFQVREKMPEALLVFLLPPSFEELERRLVGRGTDSPEVIQERIDVARRECGFAGEYDYRIVNDVAGRAVDEFAAIIEKEKNKLNAIND